MSETKQQRGPYVAGLGGAKPAVRIQFGGNLEEQRQACREWVQFLEDRERLRAAVHGPALLEALEELLAIVNIHSDAQRAAFERCEAALSMVRGEQ